MEQLCYIIQQIYSVLNILSLYSQDEREELIAGYQCFLFDINDVLIVLDWVVEGSTYWGWKINWGYQPWQLRTYCEQKGLTLQAGWEDRVDFGIELYQDIPFTSRPIWIPSNLPRVLTPIDLDAVEAEVAESEVRTDTCVTAAGWWAGNTSLLLCWPESDLTGVRVRSLQQPGLPLQ